MDVQFAYTMISVHDNKIDIKLFNYHIKLYIIIRNYDIFISTHKYNFKISYENLFRTESQKIKSVINIRVI